MFKLRKKKVALWEMEAIQDRHILHVTMEQFEVRRFRLIKWTMKKQQMLTDGIVTNQLNRGLISLLFNHMSINLHYRTNVWLTT